LPGFVPFGLGPAAFTLVLVPFGLQPVDDLVRRDSLIDVGHPVPGGVEGFPQTDILVLPPFSVGLGFERRFRSRLDLFERGATELGKTL
jgi:hypothetical protein